MCLYRSKLDRVRKVMVVMKWKLYCGEIGWAPILYLIGIKLLSHGEEKWVLFRFCMYITGETTTQRLSDSGHVSRFLSSLYLQRVTKWSKISFRNCFFAWYYRAQHIRKCVISGFCVTIELRIEITATHIMQICKVYNDGYEYS